MLRALRGLCNPGRYNFTGLGWGEKSSKGHTHAPKRIADPQIVTRREGDPLNPKKLLLN